MAGKINLSELPRETLISLIEMYSGLSLTLDGLWFTAVEDEFGLEEAVKTDEMVWGRYGEIEARRIIKTLNISGSGLDALAKALNFMMWVHARGMDCEIELEREDAAIVFTVTDCRPQKARIRSGRGEFPCKPVGIAYFSKFAKAIDPKIEVECVVCPPDPHPENVWCRWKFRKRESKRSET